MNCLGGHLRIPGDNDDNPIELGNESQAMKKTRNRLNELVAALCELRGHGLNNITAGDLLTTYLGVASQHALRMSFVTKEEA